jgi:hypothetical protein
MLNEMKYMRSHIQALVGRKYNYQELLGRKCRFNRIIMWAAKLRIVAD